MIAIDITPQEIESRTLAPAPLETAVEAMLRDGVIVLNSVIDVSHLDMLLDVMLADIQALTKRDDVPFNWNVGNLQQDPPPFPPYLFHDILLNDIVISVTRAVLGNGIKNIMYGGNTALPSTERQPVHADTGHLWPRLEVAHPPVHLVVNVPLVDVSPENGSTEIWPGTHLDTTITADKDIKIPHDVLERRRAEAPPFQPTMKRGGVLIRDMRLWHAGMPNRTSNPRPMLAMIHVPGWLETGNPLVFPVGTEGFFADSPLRTCCRFVEGAIDYIKTPHGYEYSK